MKAFFLYICCLSFLTPLFAQEAKPASKAPETPEEFHALAMENLQKQSELWMAIAEKSPGEHRGLYTKVALSYLTLKEYREEAFIAEQNHRSIHYEKMIQQQSNHQFLLEMAEKSYGDKAPKLPEELKPPSPPEIVRAPTPLPPKSYRTESGFTLRLRLED